jgi:type VI secretion system protein ImpC
MRYTFNFGRIGDPTPKRRPAGGTFRIAVLGDFSGRANAGKLETGEAIANRKGLVVDIDNFESVFRRVAPALHLPLAADGGGARMAFDSIDDFHPDQLYNNLEFFSELSGLRQRLKNNSTFASAAKEVQSWVADTDGAMTRLRPTKSRAATMPRGKLGDFARLIGKTSSPTKEEAAADELIRQIVAPHIVAAAHPDQAAMIAAVDEAISAAMRRVLHHPDFQALESLWRSVELYLRELDAGPELQIILYDIAPDELAADLSATDSLRETGIYKLLVEQPETDVRIGPPSILVGNYGFDLTPAHAELLGRIGKVAAAAHAPFIAGISPDCMVKQDPNDVDPAAVEAWRMLRDSPQANYLGLAVPRFMLRWPYGAKTEPIDSFKFE